MGNDSDVTKAIRLMWKMLFESVAGTSHAQNDIVCQDYCLVKEVSLESETVLIAVCADGAGSAAHADVGSRIACETFAESILSELKRTPALRVLSRDDALRWLGEVRAQLSAQAETMEVETRQLACTLLAAIVGEKSAAYIQVGDGAIVVKCDGDYRVVFWPQRGEYANTTTFVTQEDCANDACFESHESVVHDLAMFTDGIQMVALSYAQKAAHSPFFAALFEQLRSVADAHVLTVPMRLYLNSNVINQRTDDDKTLILAARKSVE